MGVGVVIAGVVKSGDYGCWQSVDCGYYQCSVTDSHGFKPFTLTPAYVIK